MPGPFVHTLRQGHLRYVRVAPLCASPSQHHQRGYEAHIHDANRHEHAPVLPKILDAEDLSPRDKGPSDYIPSSRAVIFKGNTPPRSLLA
jgi:hypothetical protein